MKQFAQKLENNYDGYNALSSYYHEKHENATLDKQLMLVFPSWVQGNLCASISAILSTLKQEYKGIKVRCPNQRLLNFFMSNGFYEKCVNVNPDDAKFFNRKTSIKYNQFRLNQIDEFIQYINEELPRNLFPQTSDKAWDKLKECIAEVFINATQHSKSDLVFACGQHFPQKERLDFSIVDSGIGFKQRLFLSREMQLSSLEAIDWCMIPGNTTKQGAPGGGGLDLLSKFIQYNNGKLQIVSSDGFYECSQKGIIRKFLDHAFPGTIFNLEIDTSDQQRYKLTTE